MIDRFKLMKLIVQQSENGYVKYATNSVDKCWEVHPGSKGPIHWRKDEDGFTITLHRPHSTTYVHLQDIDEVADTLMNHEDNYERFVEEDSKLADYLTSEEGKWGRQDSF